MSTLVDTIPWLTDLKGEVERHPAVNHILLSRLATGPYTRADYRNFALQHYPLVGCFTKYMELLLLRAPSSEQKLWLAKVLVDEYGEGSDGDDHATLYSAYLRNLDVPEGREREIELCREVWWFVGEHLRICREEPFLVGLGALGPGHEWAIPKMFSHIIPGLERAGVSYEERKYFDLHTEQDIDHAAWMTEALELLARTPASQAQVRQGALLSLKARYRFWTGVERRIVSWRQPFAELEGKGSGPSADRAGTLNDLRAAVDAYLDGEPWPVELPTQEELGGVA